MEMDIREMVEALETLIGEVKKERHHESWRERSRQRGPTRKIVLKSQVPDEQDKEFPLGNFPESAKKFIEVERLLKEAKRILEGMEQARK